MGPVKIAVGQMTAKNDLLTNYSTCERLCQQAAEAGCKLLCLPECFSFLGSSDQESLSIAEPLDGPLMEKYKQLAQTQQMWLSLGGFQEKGPDPEHRYNSHVLVSASGEIVSTYRKIHLFDIDIPGAPVLKESRGTAPGSDVVVADTPFGRVALTVCYDLRFPELFQELRFSKSADILLIPAAFTVPTGEAHWEVLLRARAIETQCYVIAAAQAGQHNEKRASYGHSIVIDPWGKVIGKCEDPLATDICVAEIDLDTVSSIRTRMPIATHRRYDLYDSRRSDGE
ncbi:hypothetical protein CYMTET_31144 [Cymbomonas tetramitiformis]|uniref:CN hydrolase domain-containing protein n=1 Tax=Cymbomonas tetramitiformis TaxID=36881 RepID=A0AAE0KT63_9CHLO|nr:hypothetical protein CYMTET_31144 [Cymbomonas tetramitiformis]